MKKYVIFFVLMLCSITGVAKTFTNNDTFDIIMSENVLDEKSAYLDINSATKEQMSNAGVSIRLARGIVDYREKTGGFESLAELKRIKGIGQATYEKLKTKLEIKTTITKKPLYINDANDELLGYYGFDKKEIKNIRKYLEKHNRIDNNLELMEVLSPRKYKKFKEIIKYEKF